MTSQYEKKNKTLYNALINNEKIIPQSMDFYNENCPEIVASRNKIDHKIETLVKMLQQENLEDDRKAYLLSSELIELISDTLAASEDMYYIMGYKTGVKMIVEALK